MLQFHRDTSGNISINNHQRYGKTNIYFLSEKFNETLQFARSHIIVNSQTNENRRKVIIYRTLLFFVICNIISIVHIIMGVF